MLEIANTALVIVDVQGKIAQVMHERDSLVRNLQILIRGAQAMGVPIFWCEQNPKGLGPTLPEIADLLVGQNPIPKMSFGCVGNPEFAEALKASGRKQVLLAGIETHVCIYLTAAELIAAGYEVEVVADAVSSRSAVNKEIGLRKVACLKAGVTCTETALFEMLRSAEAPQFKSVVKLLK